LYRIGLTTGIRYSWHVLDVLNVFAGEGISNVELWAEKSHANLLDPQLINALREFKIKHGINFVAVHPPSRDSWAIDNPDRAHVNRAFDIYRRLIEHSLQLGVRRMVLHPGNRRPENEDDAKRALEASADFTTRLLNYLADRPLKICVENTLPHHLGGTLAELKWLDQHVDGQFYLTLDTSHAFLSKSSIADYVEAFGRRIRHTHLSDNCGAEDDHLPPGEGNINFKEVLQLLVKNAYVDDWFLEVIKVPQSHSLPDDCRRIIDYFEKLVADVFKNYNPNA